MNVKPFDVIAVGELNADLILTGSDVVPAFGREKLVEGCTLTLGSSTALFAHGISRLGARTGYVGVCGDDQFGRLVLGYLTRAGVDTGHVQVRSDLQTGLTVSLSGPADRALMTFPGSIAALTPADVDMAYVTTARHLHMAAYYLQIGLRPQVPQIFAQAKAAGMTTSFDTGWDDAAQFGSDLDAVLAQTDIFLPNQEEALAITRESTVEAALEALARKVPTVVIKLGAEGAVARRGMETARVPAFPVEVADTTGCGDAFDAGFVYGVLTGETLHHSLMLGNACGALTATRPGGADGFPTLEQVKGWLT